MSVQESDSTRPRDAAPAHGAMRDAPGMRDASPSRRFDVAVIGAGIVGLGIAWTLIQSGRTVCVIDPDPAGGATFAAAGMLAPVSEFHYQEEHLLELMLASAALYPAFVDSLAATGRPTGYRASETLVVGVDAADRQALADLQRVQSQYGLKVEPLLVREARSLEPMLGTRVSCAFRMSGDHQVDPRVLAASLRGAIEGASEGATEGATRAIRAPRHGTRSEIVPRRAAGLIRLDSSDEESAVVGVELDDGTRVMASEVIVANGVGASELGGLPPSLRMPVRPVHGDILRMRVPERLRPLLSTTVRGVVGGEQVYLVPRDDGTLVVGATQREDGFSGVSAGGVYQLLRDAQALVPAVAELELLEVTARARPGTPDNAPLLGRVSAPGGGAIPGLIIATGFFRHGVLLTPIAAQICERLVSGAHDPRWGAFLPDRFSDIRIGTP